MQYASICNMTDNIFLNIIIAALTILLFLSTRSKNKIIPLLTLILASALSLFLIVNYFDKSMFSTTELESIKTQERRVFLGKELGRIYGNRIGIFYFDSVRPFFGKLSNNFFSALDLTRYFSSDFLNYSDRYPLILALLAILGIVLFILDIKIIPLIYFLIAISVSSLINFNSKQNLLLMLPLINLFILKGLVKSLEVTKEKLSKNV